MANPVRWSRWRLLLAAPLLALAGAACWQWARPWLHRIDHDGPLIAVQCGGKHGFIDRDGFEAIPFVWERVWNTDGDRLLVMRGGKLGFIDRRGNEVIPCVWANARPFAECGLASVYDGKRYGFIDRTGKLVLPCVWEPAPMVGMPPEFDRHGFARVWLGGATRHIDRTGKALTTPAGELHGGFDNCGLAAVKGKNGQWGAVDRTGKLALPCAWDYSPRFDAGGLSPMCRGDHQTGKWGVIDVAGRWVVPPEWDALSIGLDGFTVRRGDKRGVLDRTGKLVVPCEWDDHASGGVGAFGLLPVARNHRWGYLDRTNRLAIPLRYASAHQFDADGLALVTDDRGLSGLIDRTGREVVPCQWEHARHRFSNGWTLLQQFDFAAHHPAGAVDAAGTRRLPADYDRLEERCDGRLFAERNRHSWLRNETFAALLQLVGLDQAPVFGEQTMMLDPSGRVLWRNDLHYFRFLFPWIAAFFGLPALWLLWKARRKPPA